MKEVIEETIRLLKQAKPCVLATVVRTKGMTPQKAGAKQLIRQDGSSVGTLGGGCVEGDIRYYAKEILREKSGSQFREYSLNADMAAQDGLVCGGTMYFFLEPFWQPNEYLPFAEEISKAYNHGPPVAVATVVNSPNVKIKSGAKILIREDGAITGAIENQELLQRVIQAGKRIAAFGKNETVSAEDGTEVYVEGFTSPPTLVIMGGGHIGKSVYQLALTLGFRVIIIDDRPEFSNQERFPQAKTVVANFDTGLENLAINFNTFILVATRGHRYDDTATRAAIKTPARYIGLLGSRRKNLLIFRELLKNGASLERIKEIHAPIGLNIGALTPEELAVSIMAEIIKCIRGGDGKPMKMDVGNLTKLMDDLINHSG